MSGRRSSSCEGIPMGMAGGLASSALTGMEKLEGLAPIRTAMACSNCARATPRLAACGLGVLQGVLRFDDGDLVVDAGLVASAGDVERLFVGLDGGVVEILQRVLAAKLEEEEREVGLFAEALVFEIGGAELRFELRLADGVADMAPEIGLPGDVEGKRGEGALRARVERAAAASRGIFKVGRGAGALVRGADARGWEELRVGLDARWRGQP